MTLLSRLGYCPKKEKRIDAPRVINPSDISIVVPVKDNQEGIDRLLDKFEELMADDAGPCEVVIVDNLSYPPLSINKEYSFSVLHKTCDQIGPASARNVGANATSGEWLLFIDSDCIPSAKTIKGYSTANNLHVAYAGNIEIISIDKLSRYYASQETLIPPKAIEMQRSRPDYLVTANCLVLKSAFNEVGGFDESFAQAGGEDIDLGFKLLRIGSLAYQWESIVYHTFDDGLRGFWSRFKRYGVGNRMLAEKYGLELTPKPFIPNSVSFINFGLALIQFLSMRLGYEKHRTSISTRSDVPLRSTASG